MEFYNLLSGRTGRELGSALLAVVVLAATLTAMVALPLAQLQGKAQREQLRWRVTSARQEARSEAISQLNVIAGQRSLQPQLLRSTGLSDLDGERLSLTLLTARLGASAAASQSPLPKPSWRSLSRTGLRCEQLRARNTNSGGPQALQSCVANDWQLTAPPALLAANFESGGGFKLRSSEAVSFAVLGTIDIAGKVEVTAEGKAVEIIAAGDVSLSGISTDARSLLIHSAFGSITVHDENGAQQRCDRSGSLRLEASEGIWIGDQLVGTSWGCPVARDPSVWAISEYLGEQQRGLAAEPGR